MSHDQPSADEAELVSLQDMLWVLAQLTAGAVDQVNEIGADLIDCPAFGFPMDQSVRLPDGRFVTCFLVMATEGDFERRPPDAPPERG